MEATLHANGVIDTDILIDAMHGIPNAITFLDEQQDAGIQISIISAMELVAGCRNKVEITKLEKFLEKITCYCYRLRGCLPISEILLPQSRASSARRAYCSNRSGI